jgi:outer membrane protein OmpA-like peptidoglycan-associated protein
MRPSPHRLLLTAALALTCQAVLADGSVLRPNQLTEDALLRALDPNAQDVQAATRSIRPSMSAGAAKTAMAPSANLLITFPTGSAELTPETQQALTTVGKALQSDRLAGFAFRIEGHADPRGGDSLNDRLSEQRAESVVAFLVDKMGIGRERLNAIGKGSTELLNTTQPTAPENRRVTIVTTR